MIHTKRLNFIEDHLIFDHQLESSLLNSINRRLFPLKGAKRKLLRFPLLLIPIISFSLKPTLITG
ncbi:hypothetical protein JCM21738_4664 [Mesobacillus boroniphilus JCM 21738]|uniref:Uncharacterized protein n=1 Tax=Mesobacillus boroniphilus JCM 21738 TaxID=1294265 RepID=W4RVH5_9BACI|nr:hypothetical protein JCM21738_4664 [Mesobacillus boroniphilus JCM 21738]